MWWIWNVWPRRPAVFLSAALLFCCRGSDAHAQTLQITSPADGTTIAPGQTLTVTVTASGNTAALTGVAVVGDTPIGVSPVSTAAPYQFTIDIPSSTRPGSYLLTAIGGTGSNTFVNSDPISVHVERTDAPVSTDVRPFIMTMPIGDIAILRVTGKYSDGSTVDLTQSTLTSYASNDPTIATVNKSGLVVAVAPGFTQITINGTLNVAVTVLPPVVIVPGAATLGASQTEDFTARVTAGADAPVTWSLNPELGTIDSSGHYVAPDSIAAAQTVTLTATSVADQTQTGTATITLTSDVSITLMPGGCGVYAGQSQQFTATTSNLGTAGVVWSINPAGAGAISSSGLYTAPSPINESASVSIIATSGSNPSVSSSATCWLLPPVAGRGSSGNFNLSVSQSTVTIPAGGSAAFGFTETATNGFTDPVNFTLAGLPTGVTGTFTPSTLQGAGSGTLNLSATSDAAVGTYTAVIIATDPNVAFGESVPFALVVTAAAQLFTLQLSHYGSGSLWARCKRCGHGVGRNYSRRYDQSVR
jgi:trimeric autotransporter adhesin